MLAIRGGKDLREPPVRGHVGSGGSFCVDPFLLPLPYFLIQVGHSAASEGGEEVKDGRERDKRR
ncbi:hypothetical protein COCNU_02G018570 [Cocos nucifera]|uniref:Uncharacterized protein n=1 Tax=Cocos nucifera TaxID=13894 RepID=A0A8K0I1N2_COCNU|nr:hypothetical protein COCNU_02G018570 [Cocos nucifera]